MSTWLGAGISPFNALDALLPLVTVIENGMLGEQLTANLRPWNCIVASKLNSK